MEKTNPDAMINAIRIALDHLMQTAEESGPEQPYNIHSALGEYVSHGVTYQIQLEFVADKKLWMKEDGVRFSEVVKIHE